MRTFILAALLMLPLAAHANEGAALPHQTWSFEGFRAGWDKAQLYRGYQVFTQVCMACHSAKYISHRDMMRAGFTEAEVAALAKNLNMGLNDKLKTGLAPEDAIGSYGKVPPDLSMINKARQGGADYTYAVLTGYGEDPQEIAEALPNGIPEGAHFNRAFPGHAIAMPNPLNAPDLVTYSDGTPASIDQMAHDVSTFLQWTAEPERFDRNHLGVYVLLYLLVFTVLAYLTKRVIWKDIH